MKIITNFQIKSSKKVFLFDFIATTALQLWHEFCSRICNFFGYFHFSLLKNENMKSVFFHN